MIPVILLAFFAVANAQGGCSDNSLFIDMFYGNGPNSEFVCNVDPNSAGDGVALAIVAQNCAAGGADVYFTATYTHRDGYVTSASGGPTFVPQTRQATFFAEMTGLPYSSISDNSPVSINVNFDAVNGGGNLLNGLVGFTQTFQPTMYYFTGTTTAYVTVPSTTFVKSTITDQVVATGPATTVAMTTSGTATVTAQASTITTTTTSTPVITVTKHTLLTKTIHRSCLPPATARHRAAKRQNLGSLITTYALPWCGQPYSFTSYTTSTVVSLATITSGSTRVTQYAITTKTSTYTPTVTSVQDVEYVTTVTPPATTSTHTALAPSSILTTTSTTTVTVTKYPSTATPCATRRALAVVEPLGSLPLTTGHHHQR